MTKEKILTHLDLIDAALSRARDELAKNDLYFARCSLRCVESTVSAVLRHTNNMTLEPERNNEKN